MSDAPVFHEYDAAGFLIGWHTDPARPRSTAIAPTAPPRRARWNGAAWVDDPMREQAAEAANAARDTARINDRALLTAFNSNTASVAEIRQVLAVLIRDALKGNQ